MTANRWRLFHSKFSPLPLLSECNSATSESKTQSECNRKKTNNSYDKHVDIWLPLGMAEQLAWTEREKNGNFSLPSVTIPSLLSPLCKDRSIITQSNDADFAQRHIKSIAVKYIIVKVLFVIIFVGHSQEELSTLDGINVRPICSLYAKITI